MSETARPILYIFSGLPGVGKSTLSTIIARHFGAVYLRIDTIEQGLRDLCAVEVQGEGYRLAYRIASDNLRLDHSVVADSCNTIGLTRREWEEVAEKCSAEYRNIEVICSDPGEHRLRVESRLFPTWDEVENREHHEWSTDRIVIDTAGRTRLDCSNELLSKLSRLRAWQDAASDT